MEDDMKTQILMQTWGAAPPRRGRDCGQVVRMGARSALRQKVSPAARRAAAPGRAPGGRRPVLRAVWQRSAQSGRLEMRWELSDATGSSEDEPCCAAAA